MILPVRSAVLSAAVLHLLILLQLIFPLAAGVYAQQSGTTASPAPASTPPPGSLINTANASNYARFLPPGADVAIKYGLALRVVPSKRLDWSAGFTAATQQYSGQ